MVEGSSGCTTRAAVQHRALLRHHHPGNADLTTPNGRAYFYVNVRDFYSRIPSEVLGGGRWTTPRLALRHALGVRLRPVEHRLPVGALRAQDFGGTRLFVVGESQWEIAKHAPPQPKLRLDGLYGWGAGPSGLHADRRLTIAQVGPGFKNTEYCTGGRPTTGFDSTARAARATSSTSAGGRERAADRPRSRRERVQRRAPTSPRRSRPAACIHRADAHVRRPASSGSGARVRVGQKVVDRSWRRFGLAMEQRGVLAW